MSDFDDEIIQEFLVESYEMLDTLDESFVVLEDDPGNREVLGSIFRVMHTIKGTAGFLGFERLGELCHKSENLLSLLRDGELHLTVPMANALLSTVDLTRQLLAAIEQTADDTGVPVEELVERLAALADSHETDPEAGGGVTNEGEVDEDEVDEDDVARVGEPDPASTSSRIGDILVADHDVDRTDVEIAAAEQALGDDRRIGQILTQGGGAQSSQVELAAVQQQSLRRSAAESTIRVDVAMLDGLMNMVGELVLARNEIVQYITDSADPGLAQSSQRLDLLISELQDRVMRTRMQPIGGLWNKLPRVLRDLAQQFGKQVRLEMEGKDTELDKSLLEAIKDPLTHIVRNTVDHGIEPPEMRSERGKPVEGVLSLTAGHQDGQVVLTISDDGGGIDIDKVKAKALESGLLTAKALQEMSDTEAVELIFHPGFSTANEVSNVSGRGVGLDVVRTNIDRIGGSVSVESERGVGTTFRIEIPLTLAIVPALIVTCGSGRYAIPQRSLVELISVDGSDGGHSIEYVHDAPVIRLRDRLLPVVDLREIVDEGGGAEKVGDMVILASEGWEFGVLVDEIIETQEIVVKPLGQVVDGVDLFSGATILGDGEVALIVDVVSLSQRARLAGNAAGFEIHTVKNAQSTQTVMAEPLLLVDIGDERQAAMALLDVERLDEFELDTLEMSGHRPVVQYRSEIMPLIDLGSELGYGRSGLDADQGTVKVVVYRHNGHDVGLVIREMIDIVDHPLPDGVATGDSLIIGGRVTELVDASTLPSLASIEAEFPTRPARAVGAGQR